MSVVQVFLGQPRGLLPSIFPSISCSCVELCRIRCPRYCNFLVLNCLTISLSVPILLITSSLVIFSVHCMHIHIFNKVAVHSVETMNAKNTREKKSPIHENADTNICEACLIKVKNQMQQC